MTHEKAMSGKWEAEHLSVRGKAVGMKMSSITSRKVSSKLGVHQWLTDIDEYDIISYDICW